MSRKRRNGDHRLTEAETARLLAHTRREADHARLTGGSRRVVDELLLHLLIQTGLRPQELCALNIADTPAQHHCPAIRVCSGRRGRVREVPLSSETAQLVERFVAFHRQGAEAGDPLLLTERGSRFGYVSLYSKLRRIGREAGIEPLYPHMLRHAFITSLLEKERDIRLVRAHAGHANIKTTARYLRPAQVPAEIRSRVRCEACGTEVEAQSCIRIDSGQVVCAGCLEEIRQRSSTVDPS
jgi:integrase